MSCRVEGPWVVHTGAVWVQIVGLVWRDLTVGLNAWDLAESLVATAYP